jgi:hypothetical protein
MTLEQRFPDDKAVAVLCPLTTVSDDAVWHSDAESF